jgi:hypothetical protein
VDSRGWDDGEPVWKPPQPRARVCRAGGAEDGGASLASGQDPPSPVRQSSPAARSCRVVDSGIPRYPPASRCQVPRSSRFNAALVSHHASTSLNTTSSAKLRAKARRTIWPPARPGENGQAKTLRPRRRPPQTRATACGDRLRGHESGSSRFPPARSTAEPGPDCEVRLRAFSQARRRPASAR